MRSGQKLQQFQIDRVIYLLRTTEIDLKTIAKRMGLVPSRVAQLNKDHKVRDYQGKRASFVLI